MNRVIYSTGVLSKKGLMADANKIIRFYQNTRVPLELLIASNWKEQSLQWCDQLKAENVEVDIIHLNKRIGDLFSKGDFAAGRAEFERNIHICKYMDITHCVLHLWGWPDNNFEKILNEYKNIVEYSEKLGIELLVETIPCGDGAYNIEKKIESLIYCNPTAKFTLDTRFLCFNQYIDEVFNFAALWEEDRVEHVHISDCLYADQITPILFPGEGVIDFPKFFSNLAAKGYNGEISIESLAIDDVGNIRYEKLKKAKIYIEELLQ